MSEMREYQQKLLNNRRSKLIMCDWDRSKGKTYTIANSIVHNWCRKSVIKALIVSKNYKSVSDSIQNYLDDIFDGDFIVQGRGYEKILVKKLMSGKGKLGEVAGETVIDITVTSSIQNSRGLKIDYVYCDEYLPSSDELNIFYSSLAKQVYVLGTFRIDYISDKEIEIPNEDEWIDVEIKKLMQEFSSIDNAENTTKRREIILAMIMKLKGMRGINNEIC